MQIETKYTPDYIFESSWEVCNKVGGIYTVLSTKANSLQKIHKDQIFFVGPDIWVERESPWFKEDEELYADWINHASQTQQLQIRAGRWNVPGEPIVFLIKFEQFMDRHNELYAKMWQDFDVDSIDSYGDYKESTMFAYATGLLIESFYRFHHLESCDVIAHFNEWMLGAGALYIKKYVPKIATMFTTHATTIGRSIAGNNLPLYSNLHEYNGDQMARQLNVSAKHSIEKTVAKNVDCFTTVSDITAEESAQLLQKRSDIVTPNGFEKDFIPKGLKYKRAHNKARKALVNVAEKTIGHAVHRDALLVGISGRYEYKNKGIDVFIDSMKHLQSLTELTRDVIAFIMVPAWIKGPREDLQQLLSNKNSTEPLELQDNGYAESYPFVTHRLFEPEHDRVVNHIRHSGLQNQKKNRVKIIFVPSYLNGDDGIFNMDYYDLLIGLDMSVFPSYYEPWGYTPHESVAFAIPTITTSLSGFGAWARKEGDYKSGLDDGIEVIYRNDYNYNEVVEELANLIFDFSLKSAEQVAMLKEKATELSDKADWAHFIKHYRQAYGKALQNSFVRLSKPYKLKSD
jgi:glycogen synthase